jgi:hypothetical protein
VIPGRSTKACKPGRPAQISDLAEAFHAADPQSLQLPKIGVDLENIAAALAEAQRTGAVLISTLEDQLQQLDDEIGQAVEKEKNIHLSAADKSALDALISHLEWAMNLAAN